MFTDPHVQGYWRETYQPELDRLSRQASLWQPFGCVERKPWRSTMSKLDLPGLLVLILLAVAMDLGTYAISQLIMKERAAGQLAHERPLP
jgi:hypothetical protein